MSSEQTALVAALQWDVLLGKVDHNLATARSLIEEAAEEGTRLAVLPEMWATSFLAEGASTATSTVLEAEREIQDLSANLGIVLVGSNYEFEEDRVYNTARVYDGGTLLGSYRKIHLFSPLGEDRHFASGREPLVVDSSLGKLAIATCYDLRFPELTRWLYLQGAQILCLPAQWPEARELHWRNLCRARAIENQWFVVASNRCGFEVSAATDSDVAYPGNSMIVDPTGEVLAKGKGEPGAVAFTIDLKEVALVRRAIPVGKDRRIEAYEAMWEAYFAERPLEK